MKPEEKCVSKITAERLKAAGFPQKAQYFYIGVSNNTRPEPENWYYSWGFHLSDHRTGYENARTIYLAAPDSQEIAELLPWYIQEHCVFVGQRMEWRNPNNYTVAYGTLKDIFHSVSADSEVEARASMWLYLKENNLI